MLQIPFYMIAKQPLYLIVDYCWFHQNSQQAIYRPILFSCSKFEEIMIVCPNSKAACHLNCLLIFLLDIDYFNKWPLSDCPTLITWFKYMLLSCNKTFSFSFFYKKLLNSIWINIIVSFFSELYDHKDHNLKQNFHS